jgi:hypothetical protein
MRRRTPLEQALLGFRNQPLQREPHEDQDQRPGKNTAHVEQRLLLHHAVTNPGGGATVRRYIDSSLDLSRLIQLSTVIIAFTHRKIAFIRLTQASDHETTARI